MNCTEDDSETEREQPKPRILSHVNLVTILYFAKTASGSKVSGPGFQFRHRNKKQTIWSLEHTRYFIISDFNQHLHQSERRLSSGWARAFPNCVIFADKARRGSGSCIKQDFLQIFSWEMNLVDFQVCWAEQADLKRYQYTTLSVQGAEHNFARAISSKNSSQDAVRKVCPCDLVLLNYMYVHSIHCGTVFQNKFIG